MPKLHAIALNVQGVKSGNPKQSRGTHYCRLQSRQNHGKAGTQNDSKGGNSQDRQNPQIREVELIEMGNKSKLVYGDVLPDGSRVIFDGIDNCIGRIMPRIGDAELKASPGIQPHSKPGEMPNVVQYDAESVVTFADHWENRYRKTYPLADTECAVRLRRERAQSASVKRDIVPDSTRTLETDADKARSLDFWGSDK